MCYSCKENYYCPFLLLKESNKKIKKLKKPQRYQVKCAFDVPFTLRKAHLDATGMCPPKAIKGCKALYLIYDAL